MTTANFQIFVQALGGKFLGPNAYSTDEVTVSLKYSGGVIGFSYKLVPNVTNDGQISPLFTTGSTSFLPILTMPDAVIENPNVNYLTAISNTISAIQKDPLVLPEKPEVAQLQVGIPTPLGALLELTQPVILDPQQSNYKITVIVPGLLVLPGPVDAKNRTISVYVKMMCGCKVTQGLSTSYWTPSDYAVLANVLNKDGTSQQVPLAFDSATNDSLFIGQVVNFELMQSVQFTALQLSTGNYGVCSS